MKWWYEILLYVHICETWLNIACERSYEPIYASPKVDMVMKWISRFKKERDKEMNR